MTGYEIVKTVELSTMPNPAMAKDLLERLRLATKVVVAKRKWRVPVLKEFYPKNPSLLGLNVNRGASIMIRLRDGRDQFSFLPWESVLGTLVHELTHNEVGEHSAEFYKMMETVYDEVDASSGSTGSLWGPKIQAPKYTFDGPSAKLGGGRLAKEAGVAKDNIRQLAAEAAMRRMGQEVGPRVLGGGAAVAEGKTRKQLFLEAEGRRRQDGCSVVKTPSASEGDRMREVYAGSSNSSSGGGSSSGSGGSSASGGRQREEVVLAGGGKRDAGLEWLCQVCLEVNVAHGSEAEGGWGGRGQVTSCAWCGCAFGSTLEPQSATSDTLPAPRSGPGSKAGGARIDEGLMGGGPEFLLAGLCRRSLYEIRGCACCAGTSAGSTSRETGVRSAAGAAAVISLIDDADNGDRPPAGCRKRKAATAAVKAEKAAGTQEKEKRLPENAEVVTLLD